MEEDSERGSAIPHKRPGAGKRARINRDGSAPFAVGLWDLAPTVSTPESDALAMRGWDKNGSETNNRPTSGFLRKQCERRNGEPEFLKVEAPQGGPSQRASPPELFEGKGDRRKGWVLLPWDEPLQIWGFRVLTFCSEHRREQSYE